MKIAFSTTMGGLDDVVTPVFGRAAKFTIVELDGNEIKSTNVIDNPAFNATGGAGIQAAQLLVNNGVNAVVSGNYGPNASGILQQAGIEMYIGSGIKVKDAIEAYKNGSLQRFSSQTGTVPGSGYGAGAGYGRGMGRGQGMGRGMGRGGRGRQWF